MIIVSFFLCYILCVFWRSLVQVLRGLCRSRLSECARLCVCSWWQDEQRGRNVKRANTIRTIGIFRSQAGTGIDSKSKTLDWGLTCWEIVGLRNITVIVFFKCSIFQKCKNDTAILPTTGTIKNALRYLNNRYSLPESISQQVSLTLPWKFAVGDHGRVLAILQENIIEIRKAKDEYSSVMGKASGN